MEYSPVLELEGPLNSIAKYSCTGVKQRDISFIIFFLARGLSKGGTVAEWLERLSLVLKVPGSKYSLFSVFFKSSLSSPNGYLAVFRAGEGERRWGRGVAPRLGYTVVDTSWLFNSHFPEALRAMGQPLSTLVSSLSSGLPSIRWCRDSVELTAANGLVALLAKVTGLVGAERRNLCSVGCVWLNREVIQ